MLSLVITISALFFGAVNKTGGQMRGCSNDCNTFDSYFVKVGEGGQTCSKFIPRGLYTPTYLADTALCRSPYGLGGAG